MRNVPLYPNRKTIKIFSLKTPGSTIAFGEQKDFLGEMSTESFPNPRNFTCAETMNSIPDGQLFWAITHGVPHTSMPSYNNLKEKHVWQLILYIREFSKK